ncbi:MAG: LamG-like jellyroll fold domain-containing protein [Armatimonadota bacterium]
MRSSILILMVVIAASSASSDIPRDEVFKNAVAHWDFSGSENGFAHPVKEVGAIKHGVAADGSGAISGSRVSRLTNAYFDAGYDLGVEGNAITIYLRTMDPRGVWDYGLVAKRGNLGIMNYNLFSSSGRIGIELTVEGGVVSVTFPMSDVDPSAWHDIVARYDGASVVLFCDGMKMAAQLWKGGNLRQNDEPTLIGAETGGLLPASSIPVRPFTGLIQEAAIWKHALSDKEIASIMRKKKLTPGPNYLEPNTYQSPLQYRPDVSVLADTIPFYWKGDYHIFYLHPVAGVNWNHIVTKDFKSWKELPVTLKPDGAPDSPDGMFMFTGSVIEKDGVFHCFYTGHNPNNPNGLEFILHATSSDLVQWTKHPGDILKPDGTIYRIGKKSKPEGGWVPSDWDFRDPFVFFNEDEKCYWMVFLGDDATTGKQIQGLATSHDLIKWEFQKPLDTPIAQECPDLFKIRDIWYLIGGGEYLWSKNPRGPYVQAENPVIDGPFIYAGKSMFDGKRHIWTGWLRDRIPQSDSGELGWGGTQCLPRELYPGPNGLLYCRPVKEIKSYFKKTIIDLKKVPDFKDNSSKWKLSKSGLVGSKRSHGSQIVFNTPENYMMECSLQIDKSSIIELNFRENNKTGYRLIINPGKHKAYLKGSTFNVERNVRIDTKKPVDIQAFVLGSMIEVFVNEQYALSCRAYDYPSGKLGYNVFDGKVELCDMMIKILKE